jgi:hypothetical protein
MGFGAIIASGEKNELLRDDLMGCIVEVRVEQSLDAPTRFAIRFQEDIANGELTIIKTPELQCEQMITIAVQVEDAMRCLVRGPITDVRCSAQLGGPGSWYEVRGQDRRVELDRECVFRAWTGRASEAVAAILDRQFARIEVEATRIVYGGQRAGGRPTTSTLNQRSTDAALIRQVARQNNLHFWIEYECGLNQTSETVKVQSVKVVEKANLKSSPPRSEDAPAGPVPVNQSTLVPTVAVKLRVNVEKERFQNVTAFDLTMNPERPNQFAGTALDERDLFEHRTSVTDPQPTIEKGGLRFAGCKAQRDVYITTAGNQEELQTKAESVLTQAGWFVEATASTTAHMLGGVLIPHDVIEVEGLGSVHSGPYQVKAVTHVINAADHFMDVELRRNAIGG